MHDYQKIKKKKMTKFQLLFSTPSYSKAVADLEILKGGFSRLVKIYTQSREAAISPREALQIFLRVLFSDQEALS